MSIKRVVSTDFWTDEKVVEMFSPEDKLFFLYLLTNPHTTQLGIYGVPRKVMAFELGYSTDAVNVLLDRFENKYSVIKCSNVSNEIAIINFLKHSIFKGGKPVRDCLKSEMKQVKDKNLIDFVFSNIYNDDNINDTVKELIAEYYGDDSCASEARYVGNENENENDNENDNDNDNDNVKPNGATHTGRKSVARFSKPTLEDVQAYCKERNNSVDAERFINFYESKEWMVGKNPMKDWKAAVRTWERPTAKTEQTSDTNSSFDANDFFSAALKKTMN